jgi:hypothetical protein
LEGAQKPWALPLEKNQDRASLGSVTDDFSERFVLLCRARGLRNVDVARTLGLDQSTTSLWWKGGFPRDRGDAVTRLFGLTLGEVYSLDLETLRAQAGVEDAS